MGLDQAGAALHSRRVFGHGQRIRSGITRGEYGRSIAALFRVARKPAGLGGSEFLEAGSGRCHHRDAALARLAARLAAFSQVSASLSPQLPGNLEGWDI